MVLLVDLDLNGIPSVFAMYRADGIEKTGDGLVYVELHNICRGQSQNKSDCISHESQIKIRKSTLKSETSSQ
jgi:hypothetical protein